MFCTYTCPRLLKRLLEELGQQTGGLFTIRSVATAGHDDQLRHVARRMRTLVQGGYFGEGPVHMDSYFC